MSDIKQFSIIDMRSLTRVIAKRPRELPNYGSGGLHGEQQYCFEKGYREGIAALREAQRKRINEDYRKQVKP